jgi:hypothetical protein
MDYPERIGVDELTNAFRENAERPTGMRCGLAPNLPMRLTQAAMALAFIVSGCGGGPGAVQKKNQEPTAGVVQKKNQEPTAGAVRTNPVDGAVYGLHPCGRVPNGRRRHQRQPPPHRKMLAE